MENKLERKCKRCVCSGTGKPGKIARLSRCSQMLVVWLRHFFPVSSCKYHLYNKCFLHRKEKSGKAISSSSEPLVNILNTQHNTNSLCRLNACILIDIRVWFWITNITIYIIIKSSALLHFLGLSQNWGVSNLCLYVPKKSLKWNLCPVFETYDYKLPSSHLNVLRHVAQVNGSASRKTQRDPATQPYCSHFSIVRFMHLG